MEIYELHHKNMAEIAAQSDRNSKEIATDILNGEVKRGKHPINKPEFVLEIARSIDQVRNGVNLATLGIDFPDTGLETDPICHTCQQCPIMRDKDDVLDMYQKIMKKSKKTLEPV